MTNVQQNLWLLRYYLANAVHSKIGGIFEKGRVPRFRHIWDQLRKNVAASARSVLIVGNGPSLRPDDLSRLAFMPSIASNKIYLLFDRTSWRPSLHTISDPLLAFKLRTHQFSEFDYVLCQHRIRRLLRARQTVPWLTVDYAAAEEAENRGGFDPDPLKGIFAAHTVTVENMQLAMWLGAKRIVLIGCDHSYREDAPLTEVRKVPSIAVNHFDSRYREKGEIVNNAPIERLERSYALMHRMARRRGVEILNASRVTALEEYPRISVEELIDVEHQADHRSRGDDDQRPES